MDQLVITKAKELLEKTDGKICKHCFGRKLSPLMREENDNVKIAENVLEALQTDLGSDECVVCGNIFEKVDDYLFGRVYNKIDHLGVEFDVFMVGTTIPKEIKERDDELSNELDLNSEPIK